MSGPSFRDDDFILEDIDEDEEVPDSMKAGIRAKEGRALRKATHNATCSGDPL